MASLNKQALIRYRIIDELIRKKNFPNMQDILSECEYMLGKWFSVETIQKDIEAMKNDISLGYEAPIYYNRTYKGYEYLDKEYSINKLNLKKEEYEVLEYAVDILRQFIGSELSSSFGNAVEKISTGIKESQLNKTNPVISSEYQTDFAGSKLISDYIRFIKEKTVVSIVYTYNNIFFGDIFHPYMMKEYKNRWYIIGFSEYHDEIKSYDIRFIYDVYELTNQEFKEDILFDHEKFFEYSVGVSTFNNKIEKVQIEFKSTGYDEIMSLPLHKSQKIIKYKKNGNFIIEIEVYVTKELINIIGQYWAAAKVIKPKWLVGIIKCLISEMYKMYNVKPNSCEEKQKIRS